MEHKIGRRAVAYGVLGLEDISEAAPAYLFHPHEASYHLLFLLWLSRAPRGWGGKLGVHGAGPFSFRPNWLRNGPSEHAPQSPLQMGIECRSQSITHEELVV